MAASAAKHLHDISYNRQFTATTISNFIKLVTPYATTSIGNYSTNKQ